MDANGKIKKGPLNSKWLFLNVNGGKVILDVDKYVIMHRVGIHARDLRILDPLLSYPSTILGREKAIVLNFEHIKAIITATEVLLRNPQDPLVSPTVQQLLRRGPINQYLQLSDDQGPDGYDLNTSGDVPPFEFRALEVALEGICSFLDARTTELESAAYPALDALTKKISSRNLDCVRKLKSGMTRLTTRVQKVRDELEQLLDDDGDMSDLYLTRKSTGATPPTSGVPAPVPGPVPPFPDPETWIATSPTIGSRISRGISKASTVSTYIHGTDDIEELEMLLEAYFMQVDGALHRLTTVKSLAAL
eukprot:TRINITY_DN650_c0_g2_i2.p1 TRINITY_DN650_c0_g2~~TRINITY_DN650_c0_g2_i2.p1  ORF type:complete len:306 (-),score=60.69 TRINITY_DN650_c0_g2_i2:782-1699(-)